MQTILRLLVLVAATAAAKADVQTGHIAGRKKHHRHHRAVAEPKEVKEKKVEVKEKKVEVKEKKVEADVSVKRQELPFAELEPFGRETRGEDLTEKAVSESNAMVDQLERAEVAEEKRSVFRALTRLRGVALTSFDGIARSHTGNIEEYARTNKWRDEHPLKHLAQEEADVEKWAFPSDADF
eukprot:TRINITY_DN4771_c0_g1_i1.p1 TRINITY_DN4771_c0_g1~~TRINITY_DN4771_c0_g1_i1.p1  ORF type:complete len:182 (+),score=56.51 TRINITY_DN4771_c0_g1_i1:93-638(+)